MNTINEVVKNVLFHCYSAEVAVMPNTFTFFFVVVSLLLDISVLAKLSEKL